MPYYVLAITLGFIAGFTAGAFLALKGAQAVFKRQLEAALDELERELRR